VGLADALQRDSAEPSQAEALRDVIHVDARSGAHFLFAGDVRRLGRGAIRFERLQALISQIAQSYDLVIVDGPPVLVGTEALHLSRISDATVFVVHWGHTSHDEVTSALGQLREMRANIAGVVLSQVNPRRYKQYGRGPLSYHYARPAAGT
jgi:Mrp family chromosome partitioning ATPase